MKHSTTAAFRTCLDRLPDNIRKLAAKNFALLKQNPDHPSLQLKRVGGELWSARIGMHYRALAIDQDGGLAWLWIGSHADYDRLAK